MVQKCLTEPEVHLSLRFSVNSGNLNGSCLLRCLVSPACISHRTLRFTKGMVVQILQILIFYRLRSLVGLSLAPNTAVAFPNKKQLSNLFLFCPCSATGQICVNATFLRQESHGSERRKNCFVGFTFWGLYILQFVSKTHIVSPKSL